MCHVPNSARRKIRHGFCKGAGIRAGGALSGATTTDCQEERGCGARSVLGIAAAPPVRQKAQAEKRELQRMEEDGW